MDSTNGAEACLGCIHNDTSGRPESHKDRDDACNACQNRSNYSAASPSDLLKEIFEFAKDGGMIDEDLADRLFSFYTKARASAISNDASSVYVIERAWSDPTENESAAAFGYAPYCVVATEDKAKELVERGGLLPRDFSWTLIVGPLKPQYRYVVVPYFKGLSNTPTNKERRDSFSGSILDRAVRANRLSDKIKILLALDKPRKED